MHISFVYLLDSVWRGNKYVYLGLYCCPHNSLSSTSLKYYMYIYYVYKYITIYIVSYNFVYINIYVYSNIPSS